MQFFFVCTKTAAADRDLNIKNMSNTYFSQNLVMTNKFISGVIFINQGHIQGLKSSSRSLGPEILNYTFFLLLVDVNNLMMKIMVLSED